ncbi:phage tail tip fiber protein [Aeromonas veronii]|uniref:phage tail tip fiber protein n=1 Tax=Aeromonas veronii TaxID=654 RepID=UPI003B9ED550
MAKPAYRAGRDQAATSENVELLTGQRGNKLDKAVTFRELSALGLATLRPGAGGIYVPGKNPDLFPTGVYDKPHAPVNVQASGAFHTVLVDWDGPTYRGHAHAEVWRAETDSLPAATLVGTTIANMFSDAIGKGAKFYYWVRFVNGKDDHGPFQGEYGVVAETNRDVQDILDELQGKIESSHLAQELLKPILDVPQLSALIDETKANLAALDAREKQINDLLNHAQGALGDNYINVTLIQEQLRQLINGYQTDFEDFRDAVFAVDPSTGEITMEAVNAVRSELGAEITKVSQHLDAVEAIVKTCVTRAEISADLEKITSIEQQIDGINGKLTQTATKSEVTAVGSQVTQVGQELDAVKGTLSQKAAKTEVDAQGQRLTVAEQQISANTSANSATAQRVEQLKSEMQLADQTIKSSITELAQSVASDTQALAQKMSAMEVAMNGNTAAINELQQVITGDGQSLASKFEGISASVDLTGDAAIGAALAGADESDRQRKATGKIRREQQVLSDQQQAMASTLEQLDAEFQAESADLRGQIINEQTVRAEETGALAQRVGTVEAEFKAADKTLSANISEVAKTSADANQATATKLEQLSAKTGGIESAVQQQSEAIADLENGAQAMWTTKVQAGDITAGIGLVAKDDGTSQVALSASQVFVFDPNSATPLAPLFAIDNGQTVIAEAIIRKATIQIIHAEKITADDIKAGVSISAPLINGGQIDMGNAFMAGGAAGFGKGGPYGSWGWGWHTIIYSDGSLYTNRLYSEGGHVRNMTIGNCTIDQDCVVKGTVYADRIVGDVAKVVSTVNPGTELKISAYGRNRSVLLTTPSIRAKISTRGVVTVGITVYYNGSVVYGNPAFVSGSYDGASTFDIGERFGFQMQFGLPREDIGKLYFVTNISTEPPGISSAYYDVQVIGPLIAMAFIQ